MATRVTLDKQGATTVVLSAKGIALVVVCLVIIWIAKAAYGR